MRGEWSPEVGRGDSKHPSLPLARAERKPFDRKRKHPPRYQRENQLKEKTSSASGPRGAQSHLTERKTSPALPAREPAQRKNQLCLWPARSAKPFDRKNKIRPAPTRAAATPFYVFTQNIAVCVFNAQATSANCISQICHFDRHYF